MPAIINQFLSVVSSSPCRYPVGILYSSVLCVLSVFNPFVYSSCPVLILQASCVCPLCVRYVFVMCPLKVRFMRGVCVQVPSTDWVTHAPRTPTAYKRTMTGYIQDKTDMHRTANEYSYPLLSVSSFVHAQNFPTDTTGRTVHHLT
ncbi:hypothetical protein CI610_03414 [invertebrate metagenome]|uniref:Uncharacterized protein n=1 Tax=invertebrate metagenome TaxID=1711999 RepID=A0A2H9T392_9ZZZZ